MAGSARSLFRRNRALALWAVLLLAAACGEPGATDERASTTAGESAAPADEPDPDSVVDPAAPGETIPDPSLLDDLEVAPEVRAGYDRSRFKHWSDLDDDGCDTRQEVLIEESLHVLTLGPNCTLIGGSWFSPYDGKSTTNPSTFDVDHFVPLAEAWDSGAKGWSASERERYANDLEHPDALIAVTGSSNRSKSDQDPAEWMPTRTEFWCTYATTWIDIKVEWELTVDEEEMAALRRIFDDC